MGGKSATKAAYFDKLKALLDEYKTVFIVGVDNVSSQQMHEIRVALRGQAVVLMGKNTMVCLIVLILLFPQPLTMKFRFAVPSRASSPTTRSTSVCFLTSRVSRIPLAVWDGKRRVLELLADFCMTGNVGFIFTNGDLKDVKTKILANRVAAPARAGAIAPADVWVPAGNTGMEPGKTSFFQALGVPTKIARGTIEITTDLKLVEAGAKVGPSEATLLNMLNISPFTYGMTIAQVYDNGQTFSADVLDIEESQLLDAFTSAIKTITTVSLALNYPTLPSVMHSLVNGYKKVLAVAIQTDYSWPEIEELKDRIANPDAYASAAPAAAAPAAGGAAPAAEEKKEEEAEESDEDMGFGLFD